MQASTSDTMRKLMRLVVTDGVGKGAEVLGYYVGGMSASTEQVAATSSYGKLTNISSFVGVFPMNLPRYAIYIMIEEPHAKTTRHGDSRAKNVAAPFAGHVIGRIAPILGLSPQLLDEAAIEASISIPMSPAIYPDLGSNEPQR
jgi:cell division protein FtsI (penicillin-binding protein 3)